LLFKLQQHQTCPAATCDAQHSECLLLLLLLLRSAALTGCLLLWAHRMQTLNLQHQAEL
jgi:hypothetical protein